MLTWLIFDLLDQIEWSLNILKENKHREYKQLKDKFKKINADSLDRLINDKDQVCKKHIADMQKKN